MSGSSTTTRLLAAVDAGPMADAVLRTGLALVPLLADRLEAVTVGPDASHVPGGDWGIRHVEGDPDAAHEALVEAVRDEDVAGLVIGLRSVVGGPRPAGHVTVRLLTECPVPVVIVPPGVGEGDPLRRILLPLGGDGGLAPPTIRLVSELESSGAEITTVHVFDRSTTPMFLDRWDDLRLFAHQFADQFSPIRGPTELRVGDVAHQVLRAAEAYGSTLIVLEWKRHLAAPRAEVVRDLLCHTAIPILLVPVDGRLHPPAPDDH